MIRRARAADGSDPRRGSVLQGSVAEAACEREVRWTGTGMLKHRGIATAKGDARRTQIAWEIHTGRGMQHIALVVVGGPMVCLFRGLVWLLGASLAAQTIHTVGPGGFAQVRDAIAAASPNDVIQVHAGTYEAFTLDKALVITALPSPSGQIVQVINPLMFTTDVTVFGRRSERARA